MLESKILTTYTNRQGNVVTIRQYGEYLSIHVEVVASVDNTHSSIRALSAQCNAARKAYEKAAGTHSFGRVSQGGFMGADTVKLTNVYA